MLAVTWGHAAIVALLLAACCWRYDRPRWIPSGSGGGGPPAGGGGLLLQQAQGPWCRQSMLADAMSGLDAM